MIMKDKDLYYDAYYALRERVVNAVSELEEILEEIDMMLGGDDIMETQYRLVQKKIADDYVTQVFDRATNIIGKRKMAQLLKSEEKQDID